MKGFTDINQSKILLKILSTEGADMCYQYQKDRWVDEPAYKEYPQFEIVMDKRDIPCWSLAALLGVLPNSTDICKNIEGRYYVHGFFSDNPVDACVDAIKALHELNLL